MQAISALSKGRRRNYKLNSNISFQQDLVKYISETALDYPRGVNTMGWQTQDFQNIVGLLREF